MASNAESKKHPISKLSPEADIAIMESPLVRMSRDKFTEFMAVLTAPSAAVPEVVSLANRRALGSRSTRRKDDLWACLHLRCMIFRRSRSANLPSATVSKFAQAPITRRAALSASMG